jgi:hypothetical protein
VPIVLFPPAIPLTFHATDVLLTPFTVALNCCDPPVCTDIDTGLTATISWIATVALELMLVLAALVTATVTLPPAGEADGA